MKTGYVRFPVEHDGKTSNELFILEASLSVENRPPYIVPIMPGVGYESRL